MCEVHKAAHELLSGRSAISSRHMIWNFACPHASCLYLRAPGSYADMIALIEGNLHYFHDLSDGCSLGAELLFRAEYLLERGEFAEVEAILHAAVLRAKSKEQITVMLAAAFCRARLYAATGREAEAPALLREWIPTIQALGHVDLSTCLNLSQGYLAACLGSTSDIPEWLREGEFAPAHAIMQTAGFIQAVHGKAVLLSGDHARLDAVARALPAACGPFDNLFVRIHGKVQEALAAQHLYGAPKALEALETALDLARPDGIMLSIAEYGAHVLPLLRTLHKRNPQDAWLAALIHLTAQYPRCKNGAATPARNTRAEKLTPRETEVLHWAAKGKSNAEIGTRLGISAVTVKKLLSSAYARLGVKNRVEAVRRFAEGR